MTFGCPKSVSIAAVIGSEETRSAIIGAANKAIETTIERIGEKCIVRSGKAGKVKEHADLVASVFQHATARQVDEKTPPDPHLHFHITVINTGITRSGKTGALQGLNFLNPDFAKHYGAMMRAEFAKELRTAGFELERTKDAFELKGINQELIDELSKRSGQIEKRAPRETSSAKDKLKANLKTRQKKTEQNLDKLRIHWKAECLKYGITPKVIDRLRKTPATRSEEGKRAEAAFAAKAAAGELAQEKASFTKDELQRRTLHTAAEWGLSTKETEQAVSSFLKSNDAVKLNAKGEATAYATPKSFENAKVNLAEVAKAARERAEAIRLIKREYEAQGYRVIGAAHSSKQAEAMNNAGLKTFTMLRMLEDAYRERKLEENAKQGKREQTLFEKITLKPNPTTDQRKAVAVYKQATGQWSKTEAKKYTGEFWKPTSKTHHEFLYATRQITKQERDGMNRQLDRQERTIDGKTVIYVDRSTQDGRTIRKLIEEVTMRGGKVVIKDAIEYKHERERTQAEQALKKQTKTEQETQQQRQQQQQEQERQRTRSK